MTTVQFLKTLEDYYEQPYRSAVKAQLIARYLEQLGVDLEIVLAAVIKAHKGQYGKLPDVAAIEDVMNDPEMAIYRRYHQDALGKVWSRGRLIGHYDEERFLPFLDVPAGEQMALTQTAHGYIELLESRGAFKQIEAPK